MSKTEQTKTYSFVVSDEAVVNSYGFRVLTSGIDIKQYKRNPVVLFMHSRRNSTVTGSEVIGRCVKLTKKNGQLIADVEFDMADEFAAKIAGKVERGFLNMTSVGLGVIATSTDAKYLLPGQKYETVTKSKLAEISIADIGSNDNALRLSKGDEPIQLKKIDNSNKHNMKTIAIALGLQDNATEAEIAAAANSLNAKVINLSNEVANLTTSMKQIQEAEIDATLAQAIELGVVPETLKGAQKVALNADYETQMPILKAEINKAVELANKNNKKAIVGQFAGKQTNLSAKDPEQTFDYLQRHNPVELSRIREHEPELYKELTADYGKGVRYKS